MRENYKRILQRLNELPEKTWADLSWVEEIKLRGNPGCDYVQIALSDLLGIEYVDKTWTIHNEFRFKITPMGRKFLTGVGNV